MIKPELFFNIFIFVSLVGVSLTVAFSLLFNIKFGNTPITKNSLCIIKIKNTNKHKIAIWTGTHYQSNNKTKNTYLIEQVSKFYETTLIRELSS